VCKRAEGSETLERLCCILVRASVGKKEIIINNTCFRCFSLRKKWFGTCKRREKRKNNQKHTLFQVFCAQAKKMAKKRVKQDLVGVGVRTHIPSNGRRGDLDGASDLMGRFQYLACMCRTKYLNYLSSRKSNKKIKSVANLNCRYLK
jgi:hypothetical protein